MPDQKTVDKILCDHIKKLQDDIKNHKEYKKNNSRDNMHKIISNKGDISNVK